MLAAIAKGEYDFYVSPWAEAAASFGKPIFLRFAHEMNDPYRYPWGPQNGNRPDDFIAAWRRVHDIFQKKGATNVIWVWSPHVGHPYWDLYYPGDAFVDWTATGVLNFGPIARWSECWTFQELFGTKYERLAGFGKPIMIAEFGSLHVGGDRQAWYASALGNLSHAHPAVRAVLFFNASADQTVTYQKVDWTFLNDPEVTRTVATEIRRLQTSGR